MIKFQRGIAIAVVAFALSACSAISVTPTPPKAEVAKTTEVKSLLWVGNSFFYYNNSMHGRVRNLLSAAGKTGSQGYRGTSATISGSGLNWHDVEAYLRPGGVGSYSFVAGNEVQFNTFDKPFDAVMMMDCSQCPIHPKLQPLFFEYAKKDSEIARRHGAEPILFMSWAYADKPQMTEQLAAQYVKAGKENKALVVPAGLAFANSLSKRPDIILTVSDKRHPTLAGTYLAACTVLASVYKQSPVGNKYTADLPADVAAHLQSVAWETAQSFHAKEGRGSLN
jgi:hypothetical protein